MKISARTDKGYKRSENQDRYIAGKLANGVCFGFVCDGMGGAKGGSVAASMLTEILEGCLFSQSSNGAIDIEKVTVDAIDSACREIYSKACRDERLGGMGTTISGVTVKDGLATVYNVGDSRVYISRDGILTQITEDHSVVQELFNRGSITEEEMNNHPRKNLITRAVGVKHDVETDITEVALKKGDRLLCASDGLTNFISKEDLSRIMSCRDIYSAAGELVGKALLNNSTDNITAVVLEY